MSFEGRQFERDISTLVKEMNSTIDHCEKVIAENETKREAAKNRGDTNDVHLCYHMITVYQSKKDALRDVKRFMREDCFEGYKYTDLRDCPPKEEKETDYDAT